MSDPSGDIRESYVLLDLPKGLSLANLTRLELINPELPEFQIRLTLDRGQVYEVPAHYELAPGTGILLAYQDVFGPASADSPQPAEPADSPRAAADDESKEAVVNSTAVSAGSGKDAPVPSSSSSAVNSKASVVADVSAVSEKPVGSKRAASELRDVEVEWLGVSHKVIKCGQPENLKLRRRRKEPSDSQASSRSSKEL